MTTAPTCRDRPAGTRVRCVDDRRAVPWLQHGAEYTVHSFLNGYVMLNGADDPGGWKPSRFKPVVRVPMGRAEQSALRILPNYTVGPPQTDAQYIREWCT